MTRGEYIAAGPDAPKVSAPPTPREFQVVAVRECPYWDVAPWTDLAAGVLSYWKACVAKREDDLRFEHAALLFLDSEKRVFGHLRLTRGGQTSVRIDPRWLVVAMELDAAFVIDVHSHPHGSTPQPSEGDILLARTMSRHAAASNIPLLDSIIVMDGQACSLAANGLLEGAESGPDAEPADLLDAREKWKLAHYIMGRDCELLTIVLDEAHKQGVSAEDWIFDFVRGEARVHLAGFLGLDAKLSFVSSAIGGQDETAWMLALMDEAADRGLSTRECAWALGCEGFKQLLRARLAKKENPARPSPGTS